MTEWTHAGAQLPWLRGQGVHIAASGTERTVQHALTGAGFTVTRGHSATRWSRYQALVDALDLPATAANNLDALTDSLRDLPQLWPDVRRLALLWTGADALVLADLWAFNEATAVLAAASVDCWSYGVVFESVLFVDGFGADQPDG